MGFGTSSAASRVQSSCAGKDPMKGGTVTQGLFGGLKIAPEELLTLAHNLARVESEE